MEFDAKKFSSVMASCLQDEVENLFDLSQQWMEEDIRNGWRCFFADKVWFSENLPPPLINEQGRLHEIEKLRLRLVRHAEDPRFIPAPVRKIDGYRNYLDAGPLDIFLGRGWPGPRDEVANIVTQRLVGEETRHMWFEILRNELLWREEILDKGNLTAPATARAVVRSTQPLRDPAVLIERDVSYWTAVYGDFRPSVSAEIALGAEQLLVHLMSHLAPLFGFMPKLNNRTHLFFVQPGREGMAWAIIFDRIGLMEQGQIDFVPRLVLLKTAMLDEGKAKSVKVGPKHILFFDVTRRHFLPIYEPRELELHLRFILAHYARVMSFYEKFVPIALKAAMRQGEA